MTPKESEILSDGITPSLIESEYPGLILPADSLASVNFIDSEYSINSEYSLGPQETDIDSLTGMANNSMFNAIINGVDNSSQVTTLKYANLYVFSDPLWWNSIVGRDKVTVIATVQVELSKYHMDLINNSGGGLVLQSSVWGVDDDRSIFTYDHLFDFSEKTITRSGTYTFRRVVSRRILDEDQDYLWFAQRDEIAATLSLVSYSSAFPFYQDTRTNIFTGNFGQLSKFK